MASLTLTSKDLRTTKAAWVKNYMAILTKKENAEVAAGQAEQLLTNSEKYQKAGILNNGKTKGFASIPVSILAV